MKKRQKLISYCAVANCGTRDDGRLSFYKFPRADLNRQGQLSLRYPTGGDPHNPSPSPSPLGVGRVSSVHLKSEFSDRRMDPPPCVQNAMMTKDKKPFTYTPGGLDLSQIRSPRMARRIERNANSDGVQDVPRPPPPIHTGPLPPSALAAMQPALPVQVFPSGIPPPPPAMNNAPPPPPPPQPLPMKAVPNSDFQRPDMTKIIPDNPMALLRKTPGVNKRDYLAFDDLNGSINQEAPRNQNYQPAPPVRHESQNRGSPYQQSPNWQESQNRGPIYPQSPPMRQESQNRGPCYQAPPVQQPPANRQVQPASPPSQTKPAQWAEPQLKPVPRNEFTQPPQTHTSTVQIGSLYIPPVNKIQEERRDSPPVPPQRTVQSPGSPQSPIPTLNKAPTPWLSKRGQQQPELPTWAKRDEAPVQELRQSPKATSPVKNNVSPPGLIQRTNVVSPPVQPITPRVEPRGPPQNSIPEAVYITQPIILQHPGPRPRWGQQQSNEPQPQNYSQQQPQQHPQQQQPKFDSQGARIIPIQIEGASSQKNVQTVNVSVKSTPSPATPGSDRSLNRQLSWNANPTQSSSFKVLQKITQTDVDDEDEPVTEHSPKTTQQFQQKEAPAEHLRRLKLTEGDRELMNKFKQGVDEETFPHNEVDPRYRGPAIPSKAFKLLQSMTDGADDPASTVPRSPQGGRGPQVRTIPVQIEGEGSQRPYVPPSEQTVAEPKKYTGSSIPSRSFKMLQAMTAPENCVNANQASENTENYPYDPSSYAQWGYDPNYPPPPPPYWHNSYWQYYYQNFPNGELSATDNANDDKVQNWAGYQNQKAKLTDTPEQNSGRNTPLPYWMPQYPQPMPSWKEKSTTPDSESDDKTPRNAPQPYWGGYYYPYYQEGSDGEDKKNARSVSNTPTPEHGYSPYPMYWDPYSYYGYYCPPPMYPPAYPPYSYYPPQSDSEETAGYSSNDEMAYYATRFAQGKANLTTPINKTPSIVINPTSENGTIKNEQTDVSESEVSDSDTEVEEDVRKPLRSESSGGLQTIRSVSDINIYNREDDEINSECSEEPEIEEVSDDTTEENEDSSSIYVNEEGIVPHQLSVIFEESERSDSSRLDRHYRESSVATSVSEEAATLENSEDEDYNSVSEIVTVRLPLKLDFISGDQPTVTIMESEVKEINKVKDYINNETDSRMSVNSDTVGNKPLNPGTTFSKQTISNSCQIFDTNAEVCEVPILQNLEPDESEIKVQRNLGTTDPIDKQDKEEDDVDWWGQIQQDEEDFKPTTKWVYKKESSESKSEQLTNDNEPASEQEVKEIPVMTENKTEPVEQVTNKILSVKEQIEQMRHKIQLMQEQGKVEQSTNKIQSVKEQEVIGQVTRRLSGNKKLSVEEQEDVDFWAQLYDDDEKPSSQAKTGKSNVIQDEINKDEMLLEETDLSKPVAIVEDDVFMSEAEEAEAPSAHPNISSASSSDSSSSKSNLSERKIETPCAQKVEEESSSEESDDDDDDDDSSNKSDSSANNLDERENHNQPLSVKERIKAFQNIVDQEQQEIKISVKERIQAFEGHHYAAKEKVISKIKTRSRKSSSVKSSEEFSEEEVDSGVTSDISRHISETDTENDFPELRKMTKYQRAATHSRLFKLLQEECENEDKEDEEEETQIPIESTEISHKNETIQEKEVSSEEMLIRREHLNLPLKTNLSDPESFSSSGINSPASPTINDRLVNELVQSLLRRKKGRIYKNIPLEKLHSAALRILQEDMDGMETVSSSEEGGSFLSPLRNGTESSTPAQTPQDFYTSLDYKQYYDSWTEAEMLYDGQYDILPSKAFKLIQEHSALNRTGTISGLLARCPRVLSSKNVHKELMKVVESRESPSPVPDASRNVEKCLENSEATS